MYSVIQEACVQNKEPIPEFDYVRKKFNLDF